MPSSANIQCDTGGPNISMSIYSTGWWFGWEGGGVRPFGICSGISAELVGSSGCFPWANLCPWLVRNRASELLVRGLIVLPQQMKTATCTRRFWMELGCTTSHTHKSCISLVPSLDLVQSFKDLWRIFGFFSFVFHPSIHLGTQNVWEGALRRALHEA